MYIHILYILYNGIIYFYKIFNFIYLFTFNNIVPTQSFQRVELLVDSVSQDEKETAILRIKNWKSSGSDGIVVELIKHRGKRLQQLSFKFCDKLWEEE